LSIALQHGFQIDAFSFEKIRKLLLEDSHEFIRVVPWVTEILV
jgi:hypothetical protein